MKPVHNTAIGIYGENLATSYLQKHNYHILDRNFKARYEELDIVATHTSILVFIEVKTRISSQYGSALEAITPWKLKSLVKAAQFYKLSHKNLPEQLRIDAIAIELTGDKEVLSLEHIQNISGF